MCESGGGGAQSAMAEKLYGVQADLAMKSYANWEKTYGPLEAETAADVRKLGDPAYIQQVVDRNVQDVAEQFTKVKQERERNQWGLGINPNDGMYSAESRALKLAQAGATAGSSNTTRLALKNTQLQAKMGLVATGRGVSSQAQSGLSNAAGGYSSLANAAQQQQNAENQGTGQAVGTIVGIAAAAGF